MNWMDIIKGEKVYVVYTTEEVEAEDPYYTFNSSEVIGLFSSEDKILEWIERERLTETHNPPKDLRTILNGLGLHHDSFTVDMPERLP